MGDDKKKYYAGPDRRRSPRRHTQRVVLLVSDEGVVDGDTIDISLEGFGGQLAGELEIGDEVHVYIHGLDNEKNGRTARVVRKTDNGGMGFEFIEDEDDEIIEIEKD